ncbi:MAG: hypothetical protein AAF589_04285 [Planctomycetota bacterium]
MSKASQESPLETFWRAAIMFGTLVVGAMALYVYGPPPEKAAAMIDQVAARVQELLAETNATPPTTSPTPPLATTAPGSGVQQPAGSPLSPPPLAPWTAPAEPFRAEAPTNFSAITSQLERLGAEDIEVGAWGSAGALYRVHFAAALPGESGFRRRFDAIAATPAAAATTALADLREWRTASLRPINR